MGKGGEQRTVEHHVRYNYPPLLRAGTTEHPLHHRESAFAVTAKRFTVHCDTLAYHALAYHALAYHALAYHALALRGLLR